MNNSVENIIENDSANYDNILQARVLEKTLTMRLNEYKILQEEYNNLLKKDIDFKPWCNGVSSGMYCCASSCGTCGGSQCGNRPGGSSNCCTSRIKDSGRYCDTNEAPCIKSVSQIANDKLKTQLNNVIKKMSEKNNQIKHVVSEINKSRIKILTQEVKFNKEQDIINKRIDKLIHKANEQKKQLNKISNVSIDGINEDSQSRQMSSYIQYFLWISIVFISISLVSHLLYTKDDVSIFIYIFICIWIVIFARSYYNTIKASGSSTINFISATLTD